jgi:hypothetical protein
MLDNNIYVNKFIITYQEWWRKQAKKPSNLHMLGAKSLRFIPRDKQQHSSDNLIFSLMVINKESIMKKLFTSESVTE